MSENSDTEPILEVKKSSSKLTSRQWVCVLVLGFGNILSGASLSLQAPFYPKEAEKKGATAFEYGAVFGVFQLTMFLLSPLCGKMISKGVSSKFMLNSGIFLIGSAAILFGTLDRCPNHITFITLSFATRIVEGLGAVAAKTASYTIIVHQFPNGVAKAFSSQEMCLGFGFIVGPSLGGVLYEVGGYGLSFYVVGGLLLVDALLVYFCLPDAEKAERPRPAGFLEFYSDPEIILYFFAIFTSFQAVSFNSSMLEPHVDQFNLKPSITGLVFIIAGTLYAATTPIWGWLCDKKINPRIFLFTGNIILIMEILIVGPVFFIPLKTQLWLIILAQVLLGFVGMKLIASFTGALRKTIARGYPHDISTSAMVSSMYASASCLGAFVGPTLGGFLVESLQFRTATAVLALIELILLVLLTLYFSSRSLFGKKEFSKLKESVNADVEG